MSDAVQPINFPSDDALQSMSPDDFQALKDTVNARGEELYNGGGDDQESIDELLKMSQYAEKLDAEQQRRDADAAKRAEDREMAGSRFGKATADPEQTDTDGGDADGGEGGSDEDGADASAPPVLVEAIAAAVSSAVTASFAQMQATRDGLAAAAPAASFVRGDAKALTERLPGAAKPRQLANGQGFMAATSHVTSMKEGTPFSSPDEVAAAIAAKRISFTSSPTGTRDYLPIAHADKAFETKIGYDAVDNFTILRELQVSAPALVASGAACAEYAPSYDFFRLAVPQNPVENGLQVVQAPRGGINYIVPPSVAAAAGAIDISAQNRDYEASFVQFSAGPKACISVSCPSTQTAEVSAVSQCVTFDNLNYKVFPEQVAAFLEDVAVQFTSAKEVFYLDYINSQSTQVTADYGYGASRSLVHDWELAAVAYRKRHGMPANADLTILIPDWAVEAIKTDMALDNSLGLQHMNATNAEVEAILRARNLVPVWYNDNPTGVTPSQKFNAAQNAGALNSWPLYVFVYLFAPGTFVRLDGGTLDVGLIRDSVLNRTNDLQLFMEEWIGAAKLGFESVRLRSRICVNGGAPAAATLKTCS